MSGNDTGQYQNRLGILFNQGAKASGFIFLEDNTGPLPRIIMIVDLNHFTSTTLIGTLYTLKCGQ
jgi:hypothetical protein